MAKKAQKNKNGKRSELLIVNPNAAGIDVASAEYQVCVPEDRDEAPNRRFDAFTCDLHAIVAWLKLCGIETVAMEATGIYWIQLYDVLEAAGFDVVLCNAKHIKNLGEKKTDRVDAGWIQLLHTYGLLNDSFLPESQIREVKELSRHRERLVERCNQSILRIHKALDQMNVKVHKVISDIKGKSGLAVLRAIVDGERRPEALQVLVDPRVTASREEILKSLEGNWKESQVFILKQNLDTYLYTQGQISDLDESIKGQLEACAVSIKKKRAKEAAPLIRSKKRMNANNGPNFDIERYAHGIMGVNLTRVPGLSGLTVLKIVAELGADFVEKFPTNDHFCSWLNVTPNNKISGGKVLSSRMPKRHNYVGQALRVAANTLKNHKGYLGDLFRSKRAKLGHNQAINVVAHKLARIIYTMVKNQVEYDEDIERVKNNVNLMKRMAHLQMNLDRTKKELDLIAC